MQRRFACWAIGVIAASVMLPAGSAKAQQLPQEFVAAYRPALAAMKKTYAQGTVKGRVRRIDALDGTTVSQRFLLRFAGTLFRADVTTTTQQASRSKTSKTDILLATPSVSLRCPKLPKTSEVANSSTWISYDEAKASIRNICPLSFPYSMGTQGTILAMLRSGGVRITAFKTGTQDGERMIQIKYIQQVAPDGSYGPWKCSLLIAPDEGYALRDYSWTTGRGSRQFTILGSLRYTLDLNGTPLLQQYVRKEVQGAGGAVNQEQTIGISSFDTETPNRYYFRADGI
jgi:hypothetical protein